MGEYWVLNNFGQKSIHVSERDKVEMNVDQGIMNCRDELWVIGVQPWAITYALNLNLGRTEGATREIKAMRSGRFLAAKEETLVTIVHHAV